MCSPMSPRRGGVLKNNKYLTCREGTGVGNGVSCMGEARLYEKASIMCQVYVTRLGQGITRRESTGKRH